MPKRFLRLRVIPGEEAPGEAGVGTSKSCRRAPSEVLLVFAVKELVDVYVANIAGPQASQLVMLPCFASCLQNLPLNSRQATCCASRSNC